jgi:GPH family glycoside/pentoside/hexuronide:cation symporter
MDRRKRWQPRSKLNSNAAETEIVRMMKEKLSFNFKVAYGIGQAGEGMFGTGLGFFLLFYYSQILGLSPGLAGSAIGLAVMADAVSDIFAGSLSDHWQSRHGRRHPFMYASFVPLSVTFFLLFFPLVDSELGLFIWLAVFTNLARTMMSLYHVPHIALGAEITEDINDRSALVASRQFFSNIGGLVALTSFSLFSHPSWVRLAGLMQKPINPGLSFSH